MDEEEIGELIDAPGFIRFEVDTEFYLRNREDSLRCRMAVPMSFEGAENIPPEHVAMAVSHTATEMIAGDLDSRSSPLILLMDLNNNRHVIVTSDVQAFNVYAPTPEAVQSTIEAQNHD